MTSTNPPTFSHGHCFLGEDHPRNERQVWLVIALTTGMMLVEIGAGTVYGSMALVADGWHMSTHAGAMLIAALAYRLARRHAANPRFTFGTGKLGDLAGFASAVLLVLVALLIGWESLTRLAHPTHIDFGQAIAVAAVGLVVNLVSAWLLHDGHGHHAEVPARHHGHHHHGHHQSQKHHTHRHPRDDHDHRPGEARDNNLRAAYLHVMADALTSVLAIIALLLGRSHGWIWADPVMGIVGAVVIARWSWGLVRDTASVLLDATAAGAAIREAIRDAITAGGGDIADLHVWQVGPGHFAAIVALIAAQPKPPAQYRSLLSHIPALAHITVEVHSRHGEAPARAL